MTPRTADLKTFLSEAASQVDKKLDNLLPAADQSPARLHEAVRHSIFAGGKRFRPSLVIAVGEALGASREHLMRYAAAVEMIHTYSLIHDDLPSMDDDDLRRGRPTCHIKYGEATAVLAGDVLQTIAFKTIAEDSLLTNKQRTDLISELAGSAGSPLGMVAGQQMDIESEGKDIEIQELERIHRLKTGALIMATAKGAAVIADADQAVKDAVTEYASLLGLLFQITDDILDVTQTTAVLGKTAGKDESSSKATYPSIYGIERSNELAEDTHQKACATLEDIDESGFLGAIADYVLNREK